MLTVSFAAPRARRPYGSKRGSAAFSLVECVLAIGVVAFAFVGLMGLLPTGLSTFRKSIDLSVGSQIGERVLDDLQQSEFNTVLNDAGINLATSTVPQSGNLPHRFFDDQGNEVLQQGTTGDPSPQQRAGAHILYDVHTQVSWKGQIPAESSGSGAMLQSPSLCVVTVQIASNPGGATLPEVLGSSGTMSAPGGGQMNVSYVQHTGYITGKNNPVGTATSSNP